MPQLFLDKGETFPLFEEEGGNGVPQVVKAKMLKPGALQ